MTWDKKDEWHQHGKNFLVVVKHHTVTQNTIDQYEGVHRWNVYAYIYPKHPHFGKFEGTAMYQDAASAMPFHGGPSFLRVHRDDAGNITSVQVGSDYNHLHDDEFTHMENKDQAWTIFNDAEELFNWLTKKSEVEA